VSRSSRRNNAASERRNVVADDVAVLVVQALEVVDVDDATASSRPYRRAASPLTESARPRSGGCWHPSSSSTSEACSADSSARRFDRRPEMIRDEPEDRPRVAARRRGRADRDPEAPDQLSAEDHRQRDQRAVARAVGSSAGPGDASGARAASATTRSSARYGVS